MAAVSCRSCSLEFERKKAGPWLCELCLPLQRQQGRASVIGKGDRIYDLAVHVQAYRMAFVQLDALVSMMEMKPGLNLLPQMREALEEVAPPAAPTRTQRRARATVPSPRGPVRPNDEERSCPPPRSS